MVARAYASTLIDAPADEVWALIRDFNAMLIWNAKRVVKSEIENGKSGDAVGAIRSFVVMNGSHLREQMVSHSDFERSYSYEIRESPFEVDNYRATLRVTPVTDGDKSFVEWWTHFDCDRDKVSHWRQFFANQVFQTGLESLKAHCQSTRDIG